MEAYALLVSILLPIAGSILVASIGSGNAQVVRWASLSIASVTLVLVMFVVASFDMSGDEYMSEQLAAAATDPDSVASFRALWGCLLTGNSSRKSCTSSTSMKPISSR